MSQSGSELGSSLRDSAGAHDAAATARPNRKAERTSAVAQNFIWREKHVGKDGVALVDGTMTRTTPQPRAWDWMFQTLYSAARPKRFIDRAASSGLSAGGVDNSGNDDDNFAREAAANGTGGWAGPALHSGVGLRLHLPETVLFSHGKPTKWLGTSEWDGGVIQRRSLANTYTARAQTIKRQTGGAKPGKTFEALMIREQLKTIRQALVAFAERQAQLLARYSRKLNQDESLHQKGVGSLLVSDVDSEDQVEVVSDAPSSSKNGSLSRGGGGSSSGGGDGSGPRAGDSNSSHGGGGGCSQGGGPTRERSKAANGATAIPATVPVAVAWYNDGSREEVGLQALDMLMSQKEWLLSLSALQAYVRKPDHRNNATRPTSHIARTDPTGVGEEPLSPLSPMSPSGRGSVPSRSRRRSSILHGSNALAPVPAEPPLGHAVGRYESVVHVAAEPSPDRVRGGSETSASGSEAGDVVAEDEMASADHHDHDHGEEHGHDKNHSAAIPRVFLAGTEPRPPPGSTHYGPPGSSRRGSIAFPGHHHHSPARRRSSVLSPAHSRRRSSIGSRGGSGAHDVSSGWAEWQTDARANADAAALAAFLESAFVDSDAAKRVEAAKQHRLETKKLKKATERAARAKQEQGNSSDEDGDDDDEDFDHHVGSGDSGGASRKDHKRLRRSSAVSSSSAGGSTIGHDGNALGEEGNPSTVNVATLTAHFAEDASGTLWLTHCDDITVRLVDTRYEAWLIGRRDEDVAAAADSERVATEFAMVVARAASRGVALAHSFAHFDPEGLGYVDAPMLGRGLAGLGLGVSAVGAEELCGLIGRASSHHFTMEDLAVFVQTHGPQDPHENDDDDDDDGGHDEHGRSRSQMTTPRSPHTPHTPHTPFTPLSGGSTTGAHRRPSTSNSTGSARRGSETKLGARARARVTGSGASVRASLPHGGRGGVGRLSKAEEQAERELLADAVAMVGATVSGHAPIVEDIDFPQDLPPDLAPFDDALNATTTAEAKKREDSNGNTHGRGAEIVAGSSGSEGHGVNGDPRKATADSPAKDATASSSSSSSSVLGEDQAFVCGPGLVMTWRLTEFKDKELAAPAKAAKSSLFHRLYGEAPSLGEVAHKNDQHSKHRHHRNKKSPKKKPQREAPPPEPTPFLLIALPDATMTLEAMAVGLQPLLAKHPQGGILLLGLPGLPNTSWPAQQPLTAPHQARAAAALLAHLISSGGLSREKYLKPGVPVFWLGIGNGAPTLFQLASQHLQPSPSPVSHHHASSNHSSNHDPLRLLREQSVLFTTINGFAYVDPTLRDATEHFRRVLFEGTPTQKLQAQLSAHFSATHCAKISQSAQEDARATAAYNAELTVAIEEAADEGRPLSRNWKPKATREVQPQGFGHKPLSKRLLGAVADAVAKANLMDYTEMGKVVVLKKFWETRTELRLSPILSEAPRERKEDDEFNEQQENEVFNDDIATPSGSEGLHATLRGMAQQPDLRRDLARLPAPLLLLASSEDRWVLPTHSDATATAMTGWRYGESPESIVAHACHHMEEPSEPEGGSASALSSDHDHLHAQLSSAGLGSSSRRGSMMSSGSARQRQQRQSVAKVNPRAGLLHRVHLRAGHEVLTERPGFIVGLFTGLVQKACEELRNGPLTEPSTPAESEGPTPEPTPREVIVEIERVVEAPAPPPESPPETPRPATPPPPPPPPPPLPEPEEPNVTIVVESNPALARRNNALAEARAVEVAVEEVVREAPRRAHKHWRDTVHLRLMLKDLEMARTANGEAAGGSGPEKAIELLPARNTAKAMASALMGRLDIDDDGLGDSSVEERGSANDQTTVGFGSNEVNDENTNDDDDAGSRLGMESPGHVLRGPPSEPFFNPSVGSVLPEESFMHGRGINGNHGGDNGSSVAGSSWNHQSTNDASSSGQTDDRNGVPLRRLDGSLNLENFGVSAALLIDALGHARRKLVLARKRQATTLARWEAQNKEMVDETFALRTLKRTLSMFEEKLADIEDERGEPVPYDYQLGGENGGVPMTAGEVRLLQEKLAAKEPEVRAAKQKLAAQVELKRLSDAVVATLTAQAAQAEQVAHQASGAARKLCSDLVNRIGLLRAVEASEVQERAANASAMGLEGRRRREVGEELKRISQHSGAFIKTSVWHGGVSQRVATQQLYEGLSKEFLALRAVVKDLGRRLSEADVHVASLRRRRLVFETQLIHAERLRDLLETALLRATALNLDDLVNQECEEEAEAANRRDNADADAAALLRATHIKEATFAEKKKALQAQARGITGSAYHGAWEEQDEDEISVAIFTRAKHTSSRSPEEKAWVALDVLANPHQYAHVTEAEAEEMKYDPLYHQWRDPSGATPNPTGDDVRRILALPRNLNLALPFLFTPREIEWHRLLVKYSHGQRLEVYEDADARSAGMPLDEHGHEVPIPPLGGDHRPGHSAFEERLKKESSFHSSNASTDDSTAAAMAAMAASGSMSSSSSSGSVGSGKLSVEERTAIAQREQDEKDAQNDEIDLHLRGRDSDVLRAIAAPDKEGRLWQCLDRILSPELYSAQSLPLRPNYLRDNSSSSSSSSSSQGYEGVMQQQQPYETVDQQQHPLQTSSSAAHASVLMQPSFVSSIGSTGGGNSSGAKPYSMMSKEWECPYKKDELFALYSTVPLAELQRKAEKALVLFREEEKRLGRGRSTKMTLKNLETPETQDLAIRELMEKYYCAPELTSLGRQGRAATAHLVDEVRVVSAALQRAELWFESQLEKEAKALADDHSSVSAGVSPPMMKPLFPTALDPVPWLSDGLTHAALESVAASISDPCSKAGLRLSDALQEEKGLTFVPRASHRTNPDDTDNDSFASVTSNTKDPGQSNDVPGGGDINGSSAFQDSSTFMKASGAASVYFEDGGNSDRVGYGTGKLAMQVTGNRHRVWGSWEVVHPASVGRQSQQESFPIPLDESNSHAASAIAMFRCDSGHTEPMSTDGRPLFDPNHAHPAAYALSDYNATGGLTTSEIDRKEKRRRERTSNPLDTLETLPEGDANANVPYKRSMAAALPGPRPPLIVPNLDALAVEGSLRPLLVARKDQVVLLFEQASHLESRKSRSHRFDLVRCVEDGGPPLDDSGNDGVGSGGSRLPMGCRALDLTVTITYKGEFSNRGYRLGRLAAHLSRLPPYTPKVADDRPKSAYDFADDESTTSASAAAEAETYEEFLGNDAPPNDDGNGGGGGYLGESWEEAEARRVDGLPQAIGHAPYDLQRVNTATSLGQVVIVHRPVRVPLKMPGRYQLVVAAAADTMYTVTVTARVAEAAPVCVARNVGRARALLKVLPTMDARLDEAWETMRLAEWKKKVVEEMLNEAEAEAARAEREISACEEELFEDDKLGQMSAKDRAELENEVRVLEIEFGYWCKRFATRTTEHKDVHAGLELLGQSRQELQARRDAYRKELGHLRRVLPACAAVLVGDEHALRPQYTGGALRLLPGGRRGNVKAVDAAVAVALELNTPLDPEVAPKRLSDGLTHAAKRCLTPANQLRLRHKSTGWVNLTMDEKMWSLIDRAVHPDKYAWVEQIEATKARQRSLEQGKGLHSTSHAGVSAAGAAARAPPADRRPISVNLGKSEAGGDASVVTAATDVKAGEVTMISAMSDDGTNKKRPPLVLRRLANLTRREVHRIVNTPTKLLTQQEAQVQDLLERYHDDNSRLDQHEGHGGEEVLESSSDEDLNGGAVARDKASRKAVAARRRRRRLAVRKRLAAMEAKNFDPDRSARVRAKPESDRNFEERAWCVLDQCLNPGAWVGKDGRPIVSLLPPKAREADVTGFSLPFPLDSELAQELEDERKQKAALDAAAAAEEAQRKKDALKASRDKRKQSRKAEQKALAQGLAPGDEATRRLALANEQRSDAQARVDATAHALNSSGGGGEGGLNNRYHQDEAIPGPDEDAWDLGNLMDEHDNSFATSEEAVSSGAAATANFGTSPTMGSASSNSTLLQLESDPSQEAPSVVHRRSANVVRARLLEVWSRPHHLAKLRPKQEKLARHLLDKYNGRFEDYRDWEEVKAREARAAAEAAAKKEAALMRGRGVVGGVKGGALRDDGPSYGGKTINQVAAVKARAHQARVERRDRQHLRAKQSTLRRPGEAPDPDDPEEGAPPLGPGIPLPPVVERARAAKQKEMMMTTGASAKSTKFLLDDEDDDDDDEEEDAAALAAAEAEEDAAWAPFLVTTGTLEDMAGHDGLSEALATFDVDVKCRSVLGELDRANHNPNPFMDCNMLAGFSQRYPTELLRKALAGELDRLMRNQLLERERAMRYIQDEPEDEAVAKRNDRRLKKLKNSRSGAGGGDELSTSDSDSDNEIQPKVVKKKAKTAQEKVAEEAAMEAIRNGGGRTPEGYLDRRETIRRFEIKEALAKSQAGRSDTGLTQALEAHVNQREAETSTEAGARALNAAALAKGPQWCGACQHDGCVWRDSCDVGAVAKRRALLAQELHYVRVHSDASSFESYVPLSAMRGGAPQFRRADLVRELMAEDALLSVYARLNCVDKELHDTYATPKEYLEVASVHGYRSLMWVGDARKTLHNTRNRFIAQTFVAELVDDLLEAMLEGWAFGERESNFTVAGFAPTIKADGMIRAGTEQKRAAVAAEEKRAKREAAAALGEVSSEEVSGSPQGKNAAIEDSAQGRLFRDAAETQVRERDHQLNETENTLKFGVFMLALYYFKALTTVRREKASWQGKDDRPDGPVVRPITLERRRLASEQKALEARRLELHKVTTRERRGAAERRERREKEAKEVAAVVLAELRLNRLRTKGCTGMQRLFRGHLGRKASFRWAMKRAELEAMLSLMHGSAVTLQRAFRGFVGRMAAAALRSEMAEFMTMLRMEESAADEEEFWRWNRWKRLQRDFSQFWDTSKAVLSNSSALEWNTHVGQLPVQQRAPPLVDAD